MKLIIPCESRFTLVDGRPGSPHNNYERYWSKYAEVFDEVVVLGRVAQQEDPSAKPVEGPGVRCVALPNYLGPREFLAKRAEITDAIDAACDLESAYILIAPGAIAATTWRWLHKRRHPFGVDVIGDPYDTMAPGAMKHPFRPFFRWWLPRELRLMCREAVGSIYVTEFALQRRYPCPAHETFASNVLQPDDRILETPRTFAPGQRRKLIFVGGLSQHYKCPDVLIKATAQCVRNGVDVDLTMVGDGQYLEDLRALAAREGVGDRVNFRGRVPGGDGVYAELDQADLFVLASLQEGLPRAMVEAMSRGLPCIGSTVGGIPELVQENEMVPPGDVEALTRKITEMAGDVEWLNAASARNLKRAQDYRATVICARRKQFMEHVLHETEARLAVPA